MATKKTQKTEIEKIAGKVLGQSGSYAIETDTFDPSLLVPVPRTLNRKLLNIDKNKFTGYDVWHCHESTFLLTSGVPVAGLLKIVYPASSPNIVESKSLKLFLNSFDMCKMGVTRSEGISYYEDTIRYHLSKVLDCFVEVKFYKPKEVDHLSLTSSLNSESLDEIAHKIEDPIVDYNGGNHLRFIDLKNNNPMTTTYHTNVLRSRCHITKQKDTGTAIIQYKLKPGKWLNLLSLFRHIVALREVNEFHELCAEKLYQDLMQSGHIQECTVYLLYSRRGSLDINPIRSSSNTLISQRYLGIESIGIREVGQ